MLIKYNKYTTGVSICIVVEYLQVFDQHMVHQEPQDKMLPEKFQIKKKW